jgi:hypothetical protein
VAVISVPMIRRKVKMNDWYGIRIRAAFESEAAWYEINHYGGRLLLAWASLVAVTAIIGVFAEREYWLTYNWVALVIILGGLALVMAKIHLYARRRKPA